MREYSRNASARTLRFARSLRMSSFDKSPKRMKTKRKTKETARKKKMTRMKTQTTATRNERAFICVSGEE
jgi:hypothetical protein